MTSNHSTATLGKDKASGGTRARKTDAREPRSEPKQIDLFVPEIASWPLKDDLASMEVPIFSLSKNTDTETRVYKRGNRTIRIIPSSVGAATVFDKDLLLYVASHIVAALNDNKPVSRTIRIDSFDFLVGTERGDGANSYENILGMLRRLKGTTIETNIPTGHEEQTDGFSLINSYQVISSKTRKRKVKDPKDKSNTVLIDRTSVISFTVTISDWLWNGLAAFEVLTLDRRYFSLSKPIERRIYEVARKHCGTEKAMWKIDIDLLAEKIGFRGERFKFRSELRAIIESDSLPEYRLALDTTANPDDVVVLTKDPARFAKWLISTGCYDWYNSLEQKSAAASANA